jgi:hypothetical protein
VKDAPTLEMSLYTPDPPHSPVGEQAEQNEKYVGIHRTKTKMLLLISKNYFVIIESKTWTNQKIDNSSTTQKTLYLILFGAVSMKCNEIQNRQDTHAPEGSH